MLVEAGPADPNAFSEANLRQLCAVRTAVERTTGYAEAGPYNVYQYKIDDASQKKRSPRFYSAQCTGALLMTSPKHVPEIQIELTTARLSGPEGLTSLQRSMYHCIIDDESQKPFQKFRLS